MDAVVRIPHGRSRPLNATRESIPSATQQRAGSPAYPQNPQAAGQNPGGAVGNPAGPPTDAESEPVRRSVTPPVPGDFLLAEYELDCARFIAEAKKVARRRMEAGVARRLAS
jgi:hypothetical protein